jgi:MFS family permease
LTEPEHHPPTARRGVVTAALLLSMFLAAMEATIVATALPTIVARLGGLALYGWAGAAYLLASTVMMPLYGRLADLHGRRPLLLGGIGLFLVGCVLAGFAWSMEWLIVARLVQGLGAGAIQPITLTVVGDIYRLEERGRIQGLLGLVWGVAGVVGPVLGGVIVGTIGWRWVFWINVPFGLTAAAMLWWGFAEHRPAAPRAAIDWGGAALLTACAGALLLGAGGTATLWMLPAAVALGMVFVGTQRRARDPLLPLGLLARRDIAVSAVCSLFMGGVTMSVINYMPLYIQGVRGGGPAQAGLAVTPMLVGWPIAATLTARFILRTGFRPPVLVGSALAMLALMVTACAAQWNLSVSLIAAAMVLLGAGLGLTTTAVILGLQSAVSWSQRGVATSTNMFARSVGATLGVAMLGAFLAWGLAGRMPADRVAALLAHEVMPGAGAGLDPEAVVALAATMKPLFWIIAGFGFCNWAIALLLPRDHARPELLSTTTIARARVGAS